MFGALDGLVRAFRIDLGLTQHTARISGCCGVGAFQGGALEDTGGMRHACGDDGILILMPRIDRGERMQFQLW